MAREAAEVLAENGGRVPNPSRIEREFPSMVGARTPKSRTAKEAEDAEAKPSFLHAPFEINHATQAELLQAKQFAGTDMLLTDIDTLRRENERLKKIREAQLRPELRCSPQEPPDDKAQRLSYQKERLRKELGKLVMPKMHNSLSIDTPGRL